MRHILNIQPGDTFDVFFPDGFKVEYHKNIFDGKIYTTEVKRMLVYYWDEDDHRIDDYYFFNEDDKIYFAKFWRLTSESRKKVVNFIKNNYKKTI